VITIEKIKNLIILYGLDKYEQVTDKIISELKISHNPDLCFDIKLMLVEALTNAFEHGNEFDAHKPIYLSYCLKNEIFSFEVEDKGKGFENIVIPDELSDSDLLGSSGRGLFLITKIADKIVLKKNKIIVDKHISEVRK
jgi:serine/threonine-protein kinase RsbW